jgi:hypothetical protein
MKKYRLTDQKTLQGILNKLLNKTVSSLGTELKYTITSVSSENDMMKSTLITLKPLQDEMGKPTSIVSILKENKIELKIKLVSPYQPDYFMVSEIIIEPLERNAKRAQIRNINAENIHISQPVDIGSIISIYGKTSIINQSINNFQVDMEVSLSQAGYFMKRVNVGFFYAADTPLIEALSASKSPFFLRDSHRKVFYTDRPFFNPIGTLKDREVDAMVNKYLVNNVKSVLIVPFFSMGRVLLGYLEIQSNMPNLGNETLATKIETPQGISDLVHYIDFRTEDFTFELELAYVKDWVPIAKIESIRDISQDGKGMGLYFKDAKRLTSIVLGSKIAFSILINNQYYTFYGNVRNVSQPKTPQEMGGIGVRIHSCNKPEGIQLLSVYCSHLINTELKTA